MDSNTSVVIMFTVAFGATTLIISSLLNYRLKSSMLKMGSMDAETLRLVNQTDADSKNKVLKWALLLFFGGLGMIVLHYTGCKPDDPLPYGIEAMFIAAGLFLYYLLTNGKKKINNPAN